MTSGPEMPELRTRETALRLLVKNVLVGPDKITIRHSIPVRHGPTSATGSSPDTDSEGETRPDCQLRWRSQNPPLRGPGRGVPFLTEFGKNASLEERLDQGQHALVGHPRPDPPHQGGVVDGVETRFDVSVQHPPIASGAE